MNGSSIKLNLLARKLSVKLGIITAFLGFSVLLGCFFNLSVLKSVLPGLVTMKVNTTLGFIFSGISLWLWHQPHQRKRFSPQLLSQILAVIVALIGLLTLIQYGFNINLRIDELLIKESINAVATFSPGRMALSTALCLFWMGLALIFLSKRMISTAQGLALGSFLIALWGLLGYVFGISTFYYLMPITAMALHTSVGLIFLGLGVLLACPEGGWMKVVMSPYLGGVITRSLLPVIIGTPVLNTALFMLAHRNHLLPPEVGFVIRAIVNIFMLGGVVWWNAKYLNAIDQKQQEYQQALKESNENLEVRVQKRTAQLEAANNALNESRFKLSNLINTLPGIVFSRHANVNWTIQDLSDGCLAVTGYSKEELCGLEDCRFQNLIVVEDLPKIAAAIQTAIADNIFYQVEYRIHSKLGEEKWLWEKGIATAVDGQLQTIQGFITEITSLKQTQEALRISEERWRLATSAALDAIWEWDAASNMTTFSERWFSLLGEKPRSFTMTRSEWASRLHPDDYERVIKSVENHLLNKTPKYHSEYRVRHQDGSYKWVASQAIAQWDQQGNPIRMIGSIADITERKQTEEALRESESKFRELAENIHEVFHINSADLSEILYISPAYEEIWGRSCQSLYQNPDSWSESIHPEDGDRIVAACNRLIQGEPLQQEYRIIRPSGGIVWIFARVFPIYSLAGEILRHVGIAANITERKQAEQKIWELNQQLEMRVQQRTAELTAANKELESFSYSVSHDLRSPLRGIDGFSKALLERYQDQLDEKGKHYLTRIRSGTQRMGELIDNLLQLSRVTRSQMRLTQVNLSAIAHEIAQELSESNPERQVNWLISPDLIVSGDYQLLKIILENLLNNAWKFTSVKIQSNIELSCMNCHRNNTSLLAYFVRDNGVGFDAAYANKLFQPFQRLHTVEEFPGTGIGLATVQRIVHRHRGDVWAESLVGEGATFYFTLHP
ncbi:PAS domain-containing protein [Anabaena lutea]|uniref:histidine kinase n=1 Tax=Anabaena lutea FACHB-196 TaxID=2692881 RepID=A0ABR8FJJ6_9NOST|nr:PAS domain-containing protein [Anabaena lutea FACHB-196]